MKQKTADVEKGLWDALVIGAGPAGALAAHELARRGMKTLLVESKSFPRDKVCGGCINGRALAVLRSVGLGTLCEDLGGKTFSSIDIRTPWRKLRIPLPGGIAVSRRVLDEALVREAVRQGAQFLPETTVTVNSPTEISARHAVLCQHGVPLGEVRAKVVLACDGLNHTSLRKLPMFRSRVARNARIGIGGIARGTLHDDHQEQITMAIDRRGYVGMASVEKDQLNIAAAVDAGLVQELGMHQAVRTLLKNTATDDLVDLDHIEWHGTPPLTRHSPCLAAERLFVLGDAAGYVEPFTGEGMAMAWVGANRIVPLLIRAIAGWHPDLALQWSRVYRRAIGNRLTICRTLTALVRHPWAVRATLSVLATCPMLCAPVVERIHHAPQDLKATYP